MKSLTSSIPKSFCINAVCALISHGSLDKHDEEELDSAAQQLQQSFVKRHSSLTLP